MDKIAKALQKLSSKEKKQIQKLLRKIANGDFYGLDIVKLKSRDDIFRIRRGDLRVIYQQRAKKLFILAIERRSEKTYK